MSTQLLLCSKIRVNSLLLIVVLLVTAVASFADEQCIDYVDASELKNNPNNRYFIVLLERALALTTDKFGDYQLCPIDIPITQTRQIKELNKGRFDVFWSIATPERNREALLVPGPLIMGAYGLRALVISDLADTKISASGLRNKTFLVGRDWPDKEILESNGFKVAVSNNEDNLYRLLAKDEALVFPRAITEAWSEIAQRSNLKLKVESSLLLRYPIAMHFYVAKSSTILAERLRFGLEKLMSQSSPEQIFKSFALHTDMLRQANLAQREIIDLENPQLSDNSTKDKLRALQQSLLKMEP